MKFDDNLIISFGGEYVFSQYDTIKWSLNYPDIAHLKYPLIQ